LHTFQTKYYIDISNITERIALAFFITVKVVDYNFHSIYNIDIKIQAEFAGFALLHPELCKCDVHHTPHLDQVFRYLASLCTKTK
jgi:hypothetical protein